MTRDLVPDMLRLEALRRDEALERLHMVTDEGVFPLPQYTRAVLDAGYAPTQRWARHKAFHAAGRIHDQRVAEEGNTDA